MRPRHLHTRFLLAAGLLITTTLGTGLWSVLTFVHLSAAADEALRGSQEKIDLTAELAGLLEREDDALLLALGGERAAAEPTLANQRQRGDDCARRLEQVFAADGAEREAVQELRTNMDRYRAATSALLAAGERPDLLQRYHRDVNPLLRQAVASCARLREASFQSVRQVGVEARDEATRASGVVAAVSATAVLLAALVSAWLARSILVPVRALMATVEAVRQGDFDRRLALDSSDELGRLAEQLNEMAGTLAEYRRSSLGELLSAKMTLEATLNALPDAVLVVAPGGELASVNTPARALLQALGKAEAGRISDLPLPPQQRAAIDAALAGRPTRLPRTDFTPALKVPVNGEVHRYLLTAAPIPEMTPGHFGAVVVLDDVTDLARLEELRSELIGTASHELKTPLTSLRMNLLLLSEEAEGLPPRQREMLAAALGGCENLGATIEELLDMTRIEAGQLRLDCGPVSLGNLVEPVLDRLRGHFEDASVKVQLSQEGPALVWGDAARLGMVFTNLLTNALKYSPPRGGVTVAISPVSEPPEGQGLVRVAVTDQGPGIPPELRERVFEKFFRVEHHLGGHNGVPGTGIGLYLCREIVKAHGGSVRCQEGDQGAGACFVLLLPALRFPSGERGGLDRP
jgi:NtrC-family two-component system sensor histidine kinase KinB